MNFLRVVHGVPVVLLGDLGEVLGLGAVLPHVLPAGVAEHLRGHRAGLDPLRVHHHLHVLVQGVGAVVVLKMTKRKLIHYWHRTSDFV